MPKLENLDLVDQFEKEELGESAHQTEDDLRVESGGPLGVRRNIGEVPPVGTIRHKKNIGRPSAKKVAQPEDTPHTVTDIESGTEIENPEEVLVEGINTRHLKRGRRNRYYGIGDRRKKQQAQYKTNVKIKKGEISPPDQVWRHPSLEDNDVDKNRQWVAKRQDQIKLRGARWPKIEEKRKPK